jgi:hypothetical protein
VEALVSPAKSLEEVLQEAFEKADGVTDILVDPDNMELHDTIGGNALTKVSPF